MRKRMSKIVAVAILFLPALAWAGGFELTEQSPAAVGTSGAQSAEVDDPSAVYANPARMTYQKGLGLLGGINIIHADTKMTPPPGMGPSSDSVLTSVAPTLYLVQRIGARFAVGVGAFSNFDDLQTWPNQNFPGRFLGHQVNLTTFTMNPSVAFRPLPWLALGVGLDIVPATFEVKQTLNFGGAEGEAHASGSATGVGGNLGLFIRIVPRWLDFAFTYRSSVDLDFSGHASLAIPPELASMASSYQNAKTSITLPHNFTFGVGSHLLPHLSVDFDVHLTLWEAFKSLTLVLTDPAAPPGTPPTTQGQPLNFHIAYGLRLGFEYRLMEEKLRLRIGGGYDRTPVPKNTLAPLAPDADRGLVSVGIGYHLGAIGIDAGYLFVYLPTRSSTNPAFPATYFSTAHVVSIGVTIRFDEVGGRLNEPAFKN
jgi:long-chain fatty acid transport protein